MTVARRKAKMTLAALVAAGALTAGSFAQAQLRAAAPASLGVWHTSFPTVIGAANRGSFDHGSISRLSLRAGQTVRIVAEFDTMEVNGLLVRASDRQMIRWTRQYRVLGLSARDGQPRRLGVFELTSRHDDTYLLAFRVPTGCPSEAYRWRADLLDAPAPQFTGPDGIARNLPPLVSETVSGPLGGPAAGSFGQGRDMFVELPFRQQGTFTGCEAGGDDMAEAPSMFWDITFRAKRGERVEIGITADPEAKVRLFFDGRGTPEVLEPELSEAEGRAQASFTAPADGIYAAVVIFSIAAAHRAPQAYDLSIRTVP